MPPYSPTPAPLAYSPASYTPTPYPSPFPNFSPSPSPYQPGPPLYQSPSPYYGPVLETTTALPLEVTPAPIFHTTPSLILGLKANHHGAPGGYLPPTTWKPKYPKILEHTLRSAPSETYYGHRIKVTNRLDDVVAAS